MYFFHIVVKIQCLFHTYSTHFVLAIVQVFSSHLWQVATVLDSQVFIHQFYFLSYYLLLNPLWRSQTFASFIPLICSCQGYQWLLRHWSVLNWLSPSAAFGTAVSPFFLKHSFFFQLASRISLSCNFPVSLLPAPSQPPLLVPHLSCKL